MREVFRYRVWCDVDGKWEYVWANTEPTVCPTNAAHTIDTTKTSIIESIEKRDVKVQEESVPTGGTFQFQIIDVPSSSVGWTNVDTSFPIPISILGAQLLVDAENIGDEIEALVGPDTTTGTLASDVAISDTEIVVSQTVIDNVHIGYYLKLDDSVEVDDMGRVIAIDGTTLTMETAAVHAFAAATPTLVKQTVKMVLISKLRKGGRIEIGETKIGASYLPPNVVLRLRYNNIDGTAKNFGVCLEYLY